MTIFAMDRRGFGASTDIVGYAIEREFEDVAASWMPWRSARGRSRFGVTPTGPAVPWAQPL
jgi:hypothetical protein